MTTRPVSILDALFADVWLAPVLLAALVSLFVVELLDSHDLYWRPTHDLNVDLRNLEVRMFAVTPMSHTEQV